MPLVLWNQVTCGRQSHGTTWQATIPMDAAISQHSLHNTHGELGRNGTGELVDHLAVLVRLEGRHGTDALGLGNLLRGVSTLLQQQ